MSGAFSKRTEEDLRKREKKKQALLEEESKVGVTTIDQSKAQKLYRERVARKAGGGFQERMVSDAKKRQEKLDQERKRQEDEELRVMSKAAQPPTYTQRSSVEVKTTFEDRMQASMAEYHRKQKRSAATERVARQSTNLRANSAPSDKAKSKSTAPRGFR